MGTSNQVPSGVLRYQPDRLFALKEEDMGEWIWRELNRIAAFLGEVETMRKHLLLSGSADGDPIKISATATPGTLIHTAVASKTAFDEVYIWAANVTGAAQTLTLEWGGVTDPDNLVVKSYSIGANSLPVKIADGQLINNGGIIRAFSNAANALTVTGYIKRHE